MTIKYLTMLRDNPIVNGDSIEGIPKTEIQQLEQLYNNGNPFPKVLKELLYLAGKCSGYLDLGGFGSHQATQDEVRADLADNGIVIPRPHYFVDLRSYDRPSFIYLDKGDNPILYQIINNPTQTKYADNGLGGQRTIKWVLETAINHYKQGYSPI